MKPAYLAVPHAFASAECDAVIALAAGARIEPGPVYGGAEPRVDRSLRDVRSSFLGRAADTAWLFERLDALFAGAAESFALRVAPIFEEIQLLRYDPGGHFAMWHTDGGGDAAERRLISLSIELSDAADYEGGLLEIVPDLVGRPRTLPRGGAHLFPSRALHRVTPVTRGTRWALVAWTGAPQG